VDIAQQGSSVTLSLVGYQNGNPFTGALGQAVDTIKPFTYTAALCPRGLAPCWLPVSVDPGYIITDGPGVNTTTFLDEQLTVSLVGQAKYQATDPNPFEGGGITTPEPCSILLFSSGILGLLGVRRKWRW
jgi:hypothetical protein